MESDGQIPGPREAWGQGGPIPPQFRGGPRPPHMMDAVSVLLSS